MPPLEGKGSMSNNNMKTIIKKDYKIFDGKRKQIEKEKAEKEAIEDLKEIEKEVKELLKKRKQNTIKEDLLKDATDKDTPTAEKFIKNIQADNPEIDANNDFESNIKKVINYKK
jgi:inorganic pyrophosphatase/exopolyphosphatase